MKDDVLRYHPSDDRDLLWLKINLLHVRVTSREIDLFEEKCRANKYRLMAISGGVANVILALLVWVLIHYA